jgi:hypothetical protein
VQHRATTRSRLIINNLSTDNILSLTKPCHHFNSFFDGFAKFLNGETLNEAVEKINNTGLTAKPSARPLKKTLSS